MAYEFYTSLLHISLHTFSFSDSSFILPSHFVSIFSKCEVRLNAVYATTAVPLCHGGYVGLYSIFHLF